MTQHILGMVEKSAVYVLEGLEIMIQKTLQHGNCGLFNYIYKMFLLSFYPLIKKATHYKR